MRRKYDLRNKRNFIIIMILMIAIICIFSLFIYKYNKTSKILYKIDTGSIIQDVNKNYLNTSEDAELRIRWNDNYYLIYQDKKVNLGKKVIVYNTTTETMNLYGKFYEINSDGKVTTHNGETKIYTTNDPRFFKLDDREYLLVDSSIVSMDRSINANNYLLVELDKLGNAKLSNYKLNLKTISSTTLVTSTYKFDISNEKLTFNNLEIDLKKIIGSTNQYKEEEKKENKDSETKNGNGTNNGKTGTTNKPKQTSSSSGTINSINIEEAKNRAKSTSIIKIVAGLRQIDVDYIVHDPFGEYKSIYAEVTELKADGTKKGGTNVIPLPKNDDHIVFGGLKVNTTYRVEFIYTTVDADTGETIYHKITGSDNDTNNYMKITTKMPSFDIAVYKYSSTDKTLSYKVKLPSDYTVSKVNVTLKFKHKVYDDEGEFTIEDGFLETSEGYFDLSGYNIDRDSLLTLTITSVLGEDGTLSVNKSDSFRL